MKRIIWNVTITVLSILIVSNCSGQSMKINVLPTSQQKDWANAEIGVIIHLDNLFTVKNTLAQQ